MEMNTLIRHIIFPYVLKFIFYIREDRVLQCLGLFTSGVAEPGPVEVWMRAVLDVTL